MLIQVFSVSLQKQKNLTGRKDVTEALGYKNTHDSLKSIDKLQMITLTPTNRMSRHIFMKR